MTNENWDTAILKLFSGISGKNVNDECQDSITLVPQT